MFFQKLVLIIVGIGVAFQVIFHWGTPEKCSNNESNAILSQDETGEQQIQIKNCVQVMTWRDWLKELQFYQVCFKNK